jgi:hypothetical protein
VWQAQFAKYFHDIQKAYITQEKLLTGELADCYRELVENLALGDEDWLRKSISILRGIFNDRADNPKWIDNMESNRQAPAKYYLTLANNEMIWSWFYCRIVDAFDHLVRAKKFWDEAAIEDAKSFILQARECGVFIPAGVFVRLGLEQFILDKTQ